MDNQQNLLDYETIKGAVAGEKWATACHSERTATGWKREVLCG